MAKTAATPILEMELTPAEPAALPKTLTETVQQLPTVAEAHAGDPFLSLIERLSLDERIDPEKLGRIFDLKRGLEADRAKIEYQQAFAAMTEKLPVITKTGQIKNSKGVVQSKYARYEDIQRVVKPILREFGFTINHEQSPDTSAEMVLTTFLIHRGGHSQKSTFRAKADSSGSKNDVQGLGSIASYAKRYNVTALLDLETQGEDDDGQKGAQMAEPEGFTPWLDKMQEAAMLGVTALTDAWQKAPKPFQDYIRAKDWESLKACSRTADKAAGRG